MATNPSSSSSSLQDARERIDAVDRQIVCLLARRQSIVDEVAETKASTGQNVRDEEREARLLDRLRDLARDADLSPDLVMRLYERILEHSVRRQRCCLPDPPDADPSFSSARAA